MIKARLQIGPYLMVKFNMIVLKPKFITVGFALPDVRINWTALMSSLPLGLKRILSFKFEKYIPVTRSFRGLS